MYNKTIMVGNLTRDIELKYLPSGSAVAKSSSKEPTWRALPIGNLVTAS